MGEIIGLVAVVLIFGIPFAAIFAEHKRKMAEMGMKQGGANSSVISEIQELKRQIEELRDTTTRYDISFDSALQRMESRMNHMEQKVSAIDGGAHTTQRQLQ